MLCSLFGFCAAVTSVFIFRAGDTVPAYMWTQVPQHLNNYECAVRTTFGRNGVAIKKDGRWTVWSVGSPGIIIDGNAHDCNIKYDFDMFLFSAPGDGKFSADIKLAH